MLVGGLPQVRVMQAAGRCRHLARGGPTYRRQATQQAKSRAGKKIPAGRQPAGGEEHRGRQVQPGGGAAVRAGGSPVVTVVAPEAAGRLRQAPAGRQTAEQAGRRIPRRVQASPVQNPKCGRWQRSCSRW